MVVVDLGPNGNLDKVVDNLCISQKMTQNSGVKGFSECAKKVCYANV